MSRGYMKKKTMALIKCTECGHEVSENASSCPNCGSPIEKEIVCSECGEKLGPNDRACPKCGCPAIANSNKKTATIKSATDYNSNERLKKVQNFMEKFFSLDYMEELRPQLLSLNENQWAIVESIPFKEPSKMLQISCSAGMAGFDRFMLEDIQIGCRKLALLLIFLLCLWVNSFINDNPDIEEYIISSISFYGVRELVVEILVVAILIWWIYDIIQIRKKTQTYNYKLLKNVLNYV